MELRESCAKFKLFLILDWIFVFLFSTLAHAEIKAPEKHLQEMLQTEDAISGDYPVVLKVNDKNFDIVQKVKMRDCRISIKTYGAYGLLFKDLYKLDTWYHPHRVVLHNQFDTYALSFGITSRLMGRSNLLFKSSEKRKPVYEKLKRYAELCQKGDVKKWFRANPPNSPDVDESFATVPAYVGMIPTLKRELENSIHRADAQNRMVPLSGEESFMERFRTVWAAKKSIHGQYLIYRGDEVGKLFSEILMQKREEGLDVSLIVDGFAQFDKLEGPNVEKNGQRLFNNFMAAGIRVFGYACNGKWLRNEFRGLDFSKLIARKHDKMWVIDGELEGENSSQISSSSSSSMAIIGGMNISNEYFRLAGPGRDCWRDQDLAIRGPIVRDVYNAFKRNEEEAAIQYKSYGYDKYCFNSFDPVREREQYLDFKRKHTDPSFFPLNPEEEDNAIKTRASMETLVNTTYNHPPTYLPVQNSLFFDDRPWEGERNILESYIDMIDRAENEIIIENSYFFPSEDLRAAIRRASDRGVKVKVISNAPETNFELPIMNYGGRSLYYDMVAPNYGKTNPPGTPLEERGPEEVKIYEWLAKPTGEYNSADLDDDGVWKKYAMDDVFQAAAIPVSASLNPYAGYYASMAQRIEQKKQELFEAKIEESVMHAKFMVVDRRAGIVGSYNLTASSSRNSEAAMIFESPQVAEALLVGVRKDLDYSKQPTLAEMKEFKNPAGFSPKFQTMLAKLIKRFL